jgi:hypothetical protein
MGAPVQRSRQSRFPDEGAVDPQKGTLGRDFSTLPIPGICGVDCRSLLPGKLGERAAQENRADHGSVIIGLHWLEP